MFYFKKGALFVLNSFKSLFSFIKTNSMYVAGILILISSFALGYSICEYTHIYDTNKYVSNIKVSTIGHQDLKIQESKDILSFDTETLFYVSTDVLKNKSSNESAYRIGVRVLANNKNPNVFSIQICDSSSKKCVQSDNIDRTLIKEEIEKQRSESKFDY